MAEKPFLSTRGMSYQKMYRALRDEAFYHPDLALRTWGEEQRMTGWQDAVDAINNLTIRSLETSAR